MGTNFYFVDDSGHEKHIGKRSAAGYFCWDCGVSLAAAGNHSVHIGKNRWLESCPVCDQMPDEDSLLDGAAGRELSFNTSTPEIKAGVKTCASFNWAMSPGSFADFKKAKNLHIENEYGERVEDFQAVLSECPIMFFDMIGHEFS